MRGLEFANISKSFAELKALDDVSFSVQENSIHAIVGENGAGKSTFLKILFGMQKADGGTMRLNGEPLDFKNPSEARQKGLGMIHQHFLLAGPLTALDHIILDNDSSFALKKLNRKSLHEKLQKIAEKFKLQVPLEKPVEELGVGVQQRLEILKLLAIDAQILILDEPTAVLTPQETEAFFLQLKHLKDLGKTIILVTHKLNEVLQLADRASIFRRGRCVATVETQGQTLSSLAELMVGRTLKLPKNTAACPTENPVVLQMQNFCLRSVDDTSLLQNLDLSLRKGEIVGIAGVEGNGQDELIEALMLPQKHHRYFSGQASMLGQELSQLSTSRIRGLNVAFLAPNRQQQSLLMEEKAFENFLLSHHGHKDLSDRGFVRAPKALNYLKNVFSNFDVYPNNLNLALARFSGGNQQKFVVGRELAFEPSILIAAQPTRGVDLGAIEQIHGQILKTSARGGSVLLFSSELEELMSLSHRILVMFRGQIIGQVKGPQYDENQIGCMMGGVAK